MSRLRARSTVLRLRGADRRVHRRADRDLRARNRKFPTIKLFRRPHDGEDYGRSQHAGGKGDRRYHRSPAGPTLVLRKTSDLKHDFFEGEIRLLPVQSVHRHVPAQSFGPHPVSEPVDARAAPSAGGLQMESIAQAALCTDCGLCQALACNMNLSPNRINNYYKKIMAEQGYRPDVKRPENEPGQRIRRAAPCADCPAHPAPGHRRVRQSPAPLTIRP